jgi:amidophosphoribosyltransferase
MFERLKPRIEYKLGKEKPREECGVFGLYFPHPDISDQIVKTTLKGLLDNQHRGEESAGIAVSNGERMSVFKKLGPITRLYNFHFINLPNNELNRKGESNKVSKQGLEGYIAIGHTRYSTKGNPTEKNASPFKATSELGEVALAHNGNITNAKQLKEELVAKGYQFASTTDSEVVCALIADSRGDTWDEKIKNALSRLDGSFSLAISTKDALYAARDTIGNRPLSIGVFEKDGVTGYAISSESQAFDPLNINYQREVDPGEIIRFDTSGISFTEFGEKKPQSFCALEIAYGMRPDARINGVQLDSIRRALGAKLAENYPVPNDIDYVVYVPESAKSSCEGYAEEYSSMTGRHVFTRTGMLKGRYGSLNGGVRGFLHPDKEVRKEIAVGNYRPFDWLKDKKIVLVDDSVVRGATTTGVIESLKKKVGYFRDQGVQEIHLRIIFPPVHAFCPLGIDINTADELIAKENKTIEKVAEKLGVKSLSYLLPSEFQETVDKAIGKHLGLCFGCAGEGYPVTVFDADKQSLKK